MAGVTIAPRLGKRKKGWCESSDCRRFHSPGRQKKDDGKKGDVNKGEEGQHWLTAYPHHRPICPWLPMTISTSACGSFQESSLAYGNKIQCAFAPYWVLGRTCTTVGAKQHCCAERVECSTWGGKWGALRKSGGIALGDCWLEATSADRGVSTSTHSPGILCSTDRAYEFEVKDLGGVEGQQAEWIVGTYFGSEGIGSRGTSEVSDGGMKIERKRAPWGDSTQEEK